MFSPSNKNKPRRDYTQEQNVSGMLKNKKLSKHIADASFFELKQQIDYYKLTLIKSQLVVIDRFFPSSKIYLEYKHSKQKLKLTDRIFQCNQCGLRINRDFNIHIKLKKCLVFHHRFWR